MKKVWVKSLSCIVALINVLLILHTAIVCNYDMEYGFWGWLTHPNSTKIVMYTIVLIEALIFMGINSDKTPIYHILVLVILVELKLKFLNYDDFGEFDFLGYRRKHFIKWAEIIYGGVAVLGLIGVAFPSIGGLKAKKSIPDRNRGMGEKKALKILEKEYKHLTLYTPKEIDTEALISENRVRDILHSIATDDLTKEIEDEVVNAILHEKSDIFKITNTVAYFYYKTINVILKEDGRFQRNDDNVWRLPKFRYVSHGFKNIPGSIENMRKTHDVIHSKLLADLHYEVDDVYHKQINAERERVSENLNEFIKKWVGSRNGYEGEKKLEAELDKYNSIIGLKNIRIIGKNGASAECDYIAITQYGVYIIEAKNIGQSGNFKLRIEKDGRWSKVYKDGRIEPMDDEFNKNPIRQNEYHIMILEEYLNEKLGRSLDDSYHFKSIVALANMNVEIDNQSAHRILRVEDVMANIRMDEVSLKEAEMKLIAETLLNGNNPPKKYTVLNAWKLVYEKGYKVMDIAEKWDECSAPLFKFAEKYFAEMNRIYREQTRN